MYFYFTVNTEWLSPYIDGNPTQVYFCQSKLDVWANTAGQAKEALRTCKELLTPFFDKTHKDIVSQLTGKYKTYKDSVSQLTGKYILIFKKFHWSIKQLTLSCVQPRMKDVHNLSENMPLRSKIYREFYHSIIYIASEGCHVGVTFNTFSH